LYSLSSDGGVVILDLFTVLHYQWY